MPPGSIDHAPIHCAPIHRASLRTIASLTAAMVVVAAVAADAPVPPAPEPTQAPGASSQSGLPGCAVWTDRCVICQRDAGVISCSNIGIACQPQAMLCLRSDAAEEKKPAN
jgi:hypothetical protein